MGLYTSLVSSVLFPLHERMKSHGTVSARRDLETTQWWSAQRIAALQVERLRALLQDIAANVPYYRDLFAGHAFDPASVRSIEDLRRLPLLTKADIRSNISELKHAQARGLAKFSTGGSSGEPLMFFIGNERVSHDVAAKWRATRWWDVDIGDPEIVVWGSPIELGAQDRVRLLRDKIFRTRLLPAFEMTPDKLAQFIKTIRAVRPRMLFGYPYSLHNVARYAEREGLDMTDLGIKVAFVTSEYLYEDQRATISRVFGCKVANGYGGRDAGFIAHECPAGSMHITAEDIVVELVDPQGQPVPIGQPGEVVVTHLSTRDFPFIRYRTGDIAVLDKNLCTCGRGLPVLREIQGRTNDFLTTLDGALMPCGAFTYIIRDLPGVESFKIVQTSVLRTQVFLVRAAGFDPARCRDIVVGFKRRLGESVEIDVEFVDEIPAEKSGKFRYVVSHVVGHVASHVDDHTRTALAA